MAAGFEPATFRSRDNLTTWNATRAVLTKAVGKRFLVDCMKTSEVSYMFVLMKNNFSGEKLETQNSCFIIFSCFFFDDNFRKGIRLGENSSNPKCPNVQHCAKQIKNFKNSLITKTCLNRQKVDKFLKFYCFSLVNEIRCTEGSNWSSRASARRTNYFSFM